MLTCWLHEENVDLNWLLFCFYPSPNVFHMRIFLENMLLCVVDWYCQKLYVFAMEITAKHLQHCHLLLVL